MESKDNNNIVLNTIRFDGSTLSFKEVIPTDSYFDGPQTLVRYKSLDTANLLWVPIDLSMNIIVNERLRDTDIYYVDGQIGLGRSPLFNYKLDIAVPKDTLMTALHIGDGKYGFSLGNGTKEGFIPEIIGIGTDENDAGLYFVGISGNDASSNIPLIIFDGRSVFNDKLKNRPIAGITSANYEDYSLLLDSSENLSVKGDIIINDVIFNKYNLSLLNIIKDLQEQINYLKTKIT